MESSVPNNNNKVITYIAIAIGAIVMIGNLQMFVKAVNNKTTVPQDKNVVIKDASDTAVQKEKEPENPLGQYERYLVDAANEVNKRCPIMIDRETRLDNAMALPGNEFQYSYTLVNTERSMVDVQTVSDYIRPTLLNLVRTTPDLKGFRDNRTTMSYSYNDMNGVFLFKLSFGADDYLY